MFKKLLFLLFLFTITINNLYGKYFFDFILTGGKDLRVISSGDFNNDGCFDLILCDYYLNKIIILYGNKDGEFREESFKTLNCPLSLCLADFNNDKKEDIVVVNSTNISFYCGSDDRGFVFKGEQTMYVAGEKISFVDKGDMNGDGNMDIIIGGEKIGIRILPGRGDMTFAGEVKYGDVKCPAAMAVKDLNGDNIFDIAIIDDTYKRIRIFLTNNMTGVENDSFKGGPGNSRNIKAFNFYNGKYPDLIITNPDYNSVTIIKNIGKGRFGEKVAINTGFSPEGFDFISLNNDYFIATADKESHSISLVNSKKILTYKTGANPDRVVSGDFNGDGFIDIASISTGSPYIFFLWGEKDSFYDGASSVTGSYPTSFCKGDFNGDNITDVVVTNSNSNNISILMGNGNGKFAGNILKTKQSPWNIITDDFNSDGFLDLAVVNRLYNGMSVFLGDGKGAFSDKFSVKTGKRATDLTSGDFNRDGNPDIAVANYKGNTVSILTGNGDGTFEKGNLYNVGKSPLKIVHGDFNKDTFIDLAIAESDGGTISLLPGKGNGSFGKLLTFPSGENPVFLLSCDINKDGFSDIITVNYLSKNLSVFSGDRKKYLLYNYNLSVPFNPVFIARDSFGNDDGYYIAVAGEENRFILIAEQNGISSEYILRSSPLGIMSGNFLDNKDRKNLLDLLILCKDETLMYFMNKSQWKKI